MLPKITQAMLDALPWFHTMTLAPGLVTKGVYEPAKHFARMGIPVSLDGQRVLDIGSWDGAYSFECERRGAKAVVALDSYCWNGEGWGSKQSFELARRALHSDVRDVDRDVLDINPRDLGTFDVVLFLGVLYHMRHPLLALERVLSVTNGLLIVETEVINRRSLVPMMQFCPGAECHGDPSNWWVPTVSCVVSMLESLGCRDVQVYSHRSKDGYKRVVIHANHAA